MAPDILTAHDVVKHYPVPKGSVRAVDQISLGIRQKEVFGLVGESGCGKSTLGKVLLRLEDATGGQVFFNGENIGKFSPKQLKRFRQKAQIIYQDPYSALNPRQRVGDLIKEPLAIHGIGTVQDQQDRMLWLFERVGLRPNQARRYPHEFSGGQRQRIVIARALALNPELIVADEPVSALDVSVQAQVINLLQELGKQFDLTYVFISHDLSVVEYLCTRVAVMYLGKIVEMGPKTEFYNNPLHPYSQALLSAALEPRLNRRKKRILLQGDVPSPINPPSGCAFHPRCSLRKQHCTENPPPLVEKNTGRWVSCWETGHTPASHKDSRNT